MSSTMCKDRVRVLFLFHRRDDVSSEEFHRYWLETHGDIIASLPVVKENLLRYEQLHTNYEAKDILTNWPSWYPVADYDGIAMLEATTYEKIWKVMKHENFVGEVISDASKFINMERLVVLPLDVAILKDEQNQDQ